MNVAKAEVKILTLQGVGKDLDQRVGEARVRLYEHQGAEKALKDAIGKLDSVFKVLDAECDEGLLTEFGESLLVKKAIVRYLLKAVGCLDNLASGEMLAVIEAKGRIGGVEAALEVVRRQWSVERERLESFQQAVESGTVQVESDPSTPETPEIRVIPSALADLNQRRDQAKADKASKATVKGVSRKGKGTKPA